MDNNKKGSAYRNETAKYLWQWRKTFDIKKTSDYFKHGTTKTCQILRRSKQYLASSKRKSKIYRYLKIKNHPTRLKIALYLREWRNGLSAKKIAAKHKTDKKTVLHYLALSNSYGVSTKLLSQADQFKIKGSPFRKTVAEFLWDWRKSRNTRLVARDTGLCFASIQNALAYTKAYQKFAKNREVLGNKKEAYFVLRFAKKLRIVRSMGGKCIKCGTTDLFVLEFHHDKRGKENIVSRLLESDFERAVLEAKKCILLCRNCHIREHSQIELYTKLQDVIEYRSIRL